MHRKNVSMKEHEELTGIIDRIIFKNTDTGFSVFVLQLTTQKSTIVTGQLAMLQPGEQVNISGLWTSHPKFGRQFQAISCNAQLPTNIIGIKKYLGSGLIKGIGKIYAQKIVEQFKENTLEIIDKKPEQLRIIPGIGDKRLATIIQAWHDQKEISTLMVFLQEKEVSPTFATKIYKTYGNESLIILQQNPYRIVEDIWGIGFKTADTLAQKLGLDPTSIKRIKAGVCYLIAHATNNGHLYCDLEEIKKTVDELLMLNKEHAIKIKHALHQLHDEGKIKVITHNDAHYITLTPYYFTEKNVAQKFITLSNSPSNYMYNINAIYKYISQNTAHNKIYLNDEQQQGIIASLQHKITVITGGPGTGKTTLIRTLVHIFESAHIRYKLAAPTGRAAKRMSEGTGKSAVTLHRLLSFDPHTMGFNYNEQNALPLDFLIVDEASMIDIFLAHALLKAIPNNAHLLFIGDIDQLPSVGAGNMLNNLIESNYVPCIRLKHIFRQAQDSLIIVNAHNINNGKFPSSTASSTKKDFFYIKETDPTQLIPHLHLLFTQKAQQFAIQPHDIAILVPMNRGLIGTHQLNHELQSFLNPQKHPYILHRGTQYKISDKVMQIKNNYEKFVFNGDVGFITSVNTEDETLIVDYNGHTVEYEKTELDELVLAYAITIHKSQGSEYPGIIVPIFMQHFMLLQRNLIYTAITRAKKLCVFIGDPKAIAIGIKNNKTIKRITFLKEFLTSDLSCR